MFPDTNNRGDATTGMVAHIGAYAIEVEVFTRKPDSAAAKALLRQQYSLLGKAGS